MSTTVSSFTIEIDPNLIDPSDIGHVLDALSTVMPRLLDEVTSDLQTYQRESFASEGSLFGEPWPALAASTIAEKERLGYTTRPLIRTGALQAAIGQTVSVNSNGVFVGIDTNDVPYAIYHQAGTSKMPRRVLVSITSEEESALMNTLAELVSQYAGIPIGAVNVIEN